MHARFEWQGIAMQRSPAPAVAMDPPRGQVLL